MDANTKTIIVSRFDLSNGEVQKREDTVAIEDSLHVFLGAVHLVSILCSPTFLKELVVGHLLSEGIVQSVDHIVDIRFDGEHRCSVTLQKTCVETHNIISQSFSRLIVSACGTMGYNSLSELLNKIELKHLSSWQINASTVKKCVCKLNKLANTFRKTGGVHAAALFRPNGELIVLAEDVGRHNAVDKVIGAGSLSGENLESCFLALSGRMTGDIVLKAARVGIPIVSSLAAAIDSGVKLAEKTGVTIVGFVRGKRMNVYTHPERIKI